MGRNAVGTFLGAVVFLVVGMFVFFAYGSARVKGTSSYEISADFFKIGGLTAGSDSRINGIKVGTVSLNWLDPETFDAVVEMSIAPEIKLPTDSLAGIGSEGNVGGKYVRLKLENGDTFFAPGGTPKKTKHYRSLDDQVGEIIFLATGGPGK